MDAYGVVAHCSKTKEAHFISHSQGRKVSIFIQEGNAYVFEKNNTHFWLCRRSSIEHWIYLDFFNLRGKAESSREMIGGNMPTRDRKELNRNVLEETFGMEKCRLE